MKKLIVLAIVFIIGFVACKKEEPVEPVIPITTGTLNVYFGAELVKVELKDSLRYFSYETFEISNLNPYEHIATIKEIQPGKYNCTVTHKQKNPQGVYQLYNYSDSTEIKVNEITQFKSIY